jgi:FkbM family methyltransferase
MRSLINRLKHIEERLWPEHTFVLSQAMRQTLATHHFIVADVGSAYGTDSRWRSIEEYARFVTFEPDARSQDYATTAKMVNFATGLSCSQGEQTLYLTKLPAASSLYPLNLEQLQSFANYEWHELVGQVSIALDTLDHCLGKHPELKPDFLKVDVEGADLDVLKGGINALTQNILGLQIEVSFIERHQGAPFFSEVDVFLRERGFALFILAREHWVRRNRAYGVNSHAQLIWADAVYVLTKAQFLERLTSTLPDKQLSLLVKFLVILLGYGLHDYAIEVIDAVFDLEIISEAIAQELKQAVYASITSPVVYGFRCFSGIAVTTVLYLLMLPIAPLRRRLRGLCRKHWANLSRWGLQGFSKGGLYGSSLSDAL